MDDPINGRGRGQGILENLIPLGKDEIGGDDDTTTFIPFGQKSKEDLHFFPALLDITDVIEDDDLKTIQPFEFPFQVIITFSSEQAVDQLVGRCKPDGVIALDPFKSKGRGEMRFNASIDIPLWAKTLSIYKVVADFRSLFLFRSLRRC